MAQSLYRRYRPRRFGEVRGQEHVVTALRNAVATGTEGHAYLFSGPRGTGKTSTARILAKALNCEDLRDGEPCCECGPCVEMEAGRSFDLFELDAASNNGVDAIRDLVDRAAVGSPGRTKVYILDEVHMLSTAASNALLKTLEEPPGHVCFVLATTDPQKVLPTIRSRTQHYEFQLLSAQELTDYVRWIAADAPLDIDELSVDFVVRQGRGSARDTLSALDQVVAAGGVITQSVPVEELLRALADSDPGAAVRAVSDALTLGYDPRVLAESLLAELRDAFLLSLGVEVSHLVDSDLDRLGGWAETLGTATLTRAVEAVGAATVDMRQAADPRVPLEVALVRITARSSAAGDGAAGTRAAAGDPGADAAVVADLRRRVEVLERMLAEGGAQEPRREPRAGRPSRSAPSEGSAASMGDAAPPAAPADPTGADPGDAPVPGTGPAAARAALGAVRAAKAQRGGGPAQPTGSPPAAVPPAAPRVPTAPRPPSAPEVPTAARPAASDTPRASSPQIAPEVPTGDRPAGADVGSSRPDGAGPDREALTVALADVVLPTLKGVARAIYSSGRFVAVTDRGAEFELDNAPVNRAEAYRPDVEAALSAHLGAPVTLRLSERSRSPDPTPGPPVDVEPSGPEAPDPTPGPAMDSAQDPSEPVRSSPVDAESPDSTPNLPDGDAHDDDDELAIIDVHDLEDADVAATGVEKLTRAFPGAVLVEGQDPT